MSIIDISNFYNQASVYYDTIKCVLSKHYFRGIIVNSLISYENNTKMNDDEIHH